MRQETMLYVGLDVHKEFCQACVIDERGRALSNERFPSTHESLDVFLAGIKNAKFVLESTGIWEYIYEGIEDRGFEVVLAHPLKVRAIAEARVKTDKVDAETLAQLLRADLIPRSWVPSRDIRDLRQLVRQRTYLARQSTSFKNRISAELLRRGVRRPPELKTSFTKKDIERMRSLDIPTITSNLDCLERIQAQIEEMNQQLLDEIKRRPDARDRRNELGIGYYGALLIHAEIDDINRFLDPKKHIKIDKRYYRPTEVEYLVADVSKAKRELGFEAKIRFNDLVKIMVDADMHAVGLKPVGEGDKVLAKKSPKRWWTAD